MGNTPAPLENTVPPGETNPTLNEGRKLPLGLYFCGWVVVSLGLYIAGRRFAEADSSASHPLWVSLLGGAVWPLVLIGAMEFSSVVLYTKAHKA